MIRCSDKKFPQIAAYVFDLVGVPFVGSPQLVLEPFARTSVPSAQSTAGKRTAAHVYSVRQPIAKSLVRGSCYLVVVQSSNSIRVILLKWLELFVTIVNLWVTDVTPIERSKSSIGDNQILFQNGSISLVNNLLLRISSIISSAVFSDSKAPNDFLNVDFLFPKSVLTDSVNLEINDVNLTKKVHIRYPAEHSKSPTHDQRTAAHSLFSNYIAYDSRGNLS